MTPELDVDSGAFPSAPPADLDDPGVIVEHDWRSFQAVERMSNHWDRPGWSDRRRTYYWMLTFSNAIELSRRAEHCQEALQHLGMDPVPADGLHVTMLRVGDIDRVSQAQVEHLLNMAEKMPVSEFELLAHPLTGSRGAVRFSLSPGDHSSTSTPPSAPPASRLASPAAGRRVRSGPTWASPTTTGNGRQLPSSTRSHDFARCPRSLS